MPRAFPRWTNAAARVTIAGLVVFICAGGWVAWRLQNSSFATSQGVPIEQPIPFSHEHHVNGLGIDCRYCHTSVTESNFAGLPPTKTCMTCHSQIWTGAPMLEPVRQSWRNGDPIRWQRVNNLPQYVYFNHQIHVNKGVGCVTCHGQVDQMPLTAQAAPLQMSWCLDCHRDPAKYLRPRDQVFNMNFVPSQDQSVLGKQLVESYHIRPAQDLTDCYTCHR